MFAIERRLFQSRWKKCILWQNKLVFSIASVWPCPYLCQYGYKSSRVKLHKVRPPPRLTTNIRLWCTRSTNTLAYFIIPPSSHRPPAPSPPTKLTWCRFLLKTSISMMWNETRTVIFFSFFSKKFELVWWIFKKLHRIILWSAYVILWSFHDHTFFLQSITLLLSYKHLMIFLQVPYDHIWIISWSHNHLMITSQSSHVHLTIFLWSYKISKSSYNDLIIILQFSYTNITLILQFYKNLKFASWSSYYFLMIICQSSYNDSMNILQILLSSYIYNYDLAIIIWPSYPKLPMILLPSPDYFIVNFRPGVS